MTSFELRLNKARRYFKGLARMSELLTFLLENQEQFRRRARLPALYSDFRHLGATNPDGYAANISAWLGGLEAAARAGVLPARGAAADVLALQVDDDICRALETREWGRPLALGAVAREGIAAGQLLPLTGFMDATTSIYTRTWMPALRPWAVLGWGFRQLGLGWGEGEDKLPAGKLVVLANVQEAGSEFARRTEGQSGRIERIYSKEKFTSTFRDVFGEKQPLSNTDIEIFLRFLQRDKKLISYDGTTIKLKAPTEGLPSEITAEDATIASLKTLITDLQAQTEQLTARVDALDIKARESVARKNRVSALATLRSKKLAETTLSKRHATLAQLEEVFAKIEQAADHVELVNVMEGSTKVLAGLNKEVGGVDRVDDVVDRLREEIGKVDEVGDVIAEVGSAHIDEMEVDDELEALEREEHAKVEKAEQAVKEEKEKMEKKEAEERERKEAEGTRRRLEALDQAELERQVADKKREEEAAEKIPQETNSKSEEEIDQALEDSVRELEQLVL